MQRSCGLSNRSPDGRRDDACDRDRRSRPVSFGFEPARGRSRGAGDLRGVRLPGTRRELVDLTASADPRAAGPGSGVAGAPAPRDRPGRCGGATGGRPSHRPDGAPPGCHRRSRSRHRWSRRCGARIRPLDAAGNGRAVGAWHRHGSVGRGGGRPRRGPRTTAGQVAHAPSLRRIQPWYRRRRLPRGADVRLARSRGSPHRRCRRTRRRRDVRGSPALPPRAPAHDRLAAGEGTPHAAGLVAGPSHGGHRSHCAGLRRGGRGGKQLDKPCRHRPSTPPLPSGPLPTPCSSPQSRWADGSGRRASTEWADPSLCVRLPPRQQAVSRCSRWGRIRRRYAPAR